jgi:tRNA(Ile)-lysidine synthase
MQVALESLFLQRWTGVPWQDTRVLIACSGGPDSTALLRLLARHQPDRSKLVVAHFHHRLRADSADADAHFVEQLSQSLGIPAVVGAADPQAMQQARVGAGLEAAARRLRYQFLIRAAEQHGARYVATGHTADDQIETVLHRILRGTGLAGLAGIPAVRIASPAVTVVRPLLEWTRSEIVAYLHAIDQPARSDELNASDDFLRNRIRHELLPLLERRYHPGVRRSLQRLARIAADTQQVVQACASDMLDRRLEPQSPDRVELDLEPLAPLPPHVRREVFVEIWRRQRWPAQEMSFAHWQRLAAAGAAEADVTAFDLPGPVHVQRSAQRMSLELRRRH